MPTTPSTQSAQAWTDHVMDVRSKVEFAKPGEIIVQRDAAQRLHCLTGPAIKTCTHVIHFVDGRRHGIAADRWGTITYWYKGVQVPDYFLTDPDRISFETLMEHPNAEVRQVGLEIYGYERLLNEGKLVKLHADPEKQAILYKPDLPNSGDQNDGPLGDETVLYNVVQVTDAVKQPDGTRRKFFLRVPNTIKTCREAVAWTFYMSEEEYNPLVET